MDKLNELLKWFEQLPVNVPFMMKEVFQENASFVEDLNIAQLARGERVDGSSLPNYSPVSVFKFGKTPGPMNLHDKGPFWAGITLIVTNDGIELQGRDIKTEMLEVRYGEVVGLQEESKDTVEQEILKPELEGKIQKSKPK